MFVTTTLKSMDDYFSQLNPIAHRIAKDIKDTELAYGKLWYTLNAHEQNDIINETLIRAEIALKYFDSFSLSSFSSSGENIKKHHCKQQQSIDISNSHLTYSLSGLKNLNDLSPTLSSASGKATKTVDIGGCKGGQEQETKFLYNSNFNNIYGFDERNLGTFTVQKVALKIINDEAGGTYRDEHSTPFSYRTKSQINLHLFANNIDQQIIETDPILTEKPTAASSLLCDGKVQNIIKYTIERDEKINLNYKKLHNELKMNISEKNLNKKFCNSHHKITNTDAIACNKSNMFNNIINQTETSALTSSTPVSLLKNLIDTNKCTSPLMNYAIFSNTFYENEESSNLMQNCFTNSSTPSPTSDIDDRYDYDDIKTCEATNLLDNDINLRKGFDFLNNW